MIVLRFMGEGDPERFRCRVYCGGVGPEFEEARAEAERRAFIERLAGDGVIEAPAYDGWIGALRERGWLPGRPELEPAPGGGYYARWRLTAKGRSEWERLR